MTSRTLLAWLLGGVALAGVSHAQPALETRVSKDRGELEVRFKGKPLLVYAFADSQFKPYVRELRTLAGDNVLRDAPADHLHHHGLMYAIRVNGVNFWEEVGQPGWERSVDVKAEPVTESAVPSATFVDTVQWFAVKTNSPNANSALLIERRRITVSIDEASEEVAVQWQSDFEVGKAAPKVTLTGSSYNGLGLRLPEAFDKVAVHRNPDELPYPSEGKTDVLPVKWSSVTGRSGGSGTYAFAKGGGIEPVVGPKGGRDVMVTLFGHPSNPGETLFFTMLTPFTYVAVTQNLEKKPLEYASGQTYRLRYLLLAYPNAKPKEFITDRYARWEAK